MSRHHHNPVRFYPIQIHVGCGRASGRMAAHELPLFAGAPDNLSSLDFLNEYVLANTCFLTDYLQCTVEIIVRAGVSEKSELWISCDHPSNQTMYRNGDFSFCFLREHVDDVIRKILPCQMDDIGKPQCCATADDEKIAYACLGVR